jgi:hypothetical protein
MNKFITYHLIMALGIFFTACHEDKGNYDYRELVDFYVDPQGIPGNITVTQFRTLHLPSNLVYGGNKDDLEYAWLVFKQGATILEETTIDTLATTENLAAPVPVLPGTYTLVFTAMERESKRSTLQSYSLTVEGAIGTGLLVLHEKNGSVDCDLVKTRTLVGSLARDTVLRTIYSQANPGYPLSGKPLQMAVNTRLVYIYLFTDTDAVRLSPVDMSIMARFDGLFFSVPGTAKPQGYNLTGGGNFETLINDGKYHFIPIVYVSLGAEKDALFTAAAAGDYYAAPYVVQASILSLPVFYDQAGMRFCVYSTDAVPISSTAPGNAFDFSNVGKKMVYMESGFGTGNVHSIFKNPVEDGSRYLYLMNVNTSASSSFKANAAYDISAWPDIANARYFTLSTRGPVGFYATDNKVYRYTYSSNDFTVQPTAQEAWPYIPAGETITAIQLVKYAGSSVPSSTLDRYLLIATYNETSGEGKLYVIEIDVVNGLCTTTPVAIYDQFGKVTNMTFKSV